MFIFNFDIELIVSIFEPVKFYVGFYIFCMQEFFYISFSEVHTFELILLSAFTVLLLLRTLYLFLVTGRAVNRKEQPSKMLNYEPISLLLTCRNEEENLLKHLPEILKIENVDFEVVVIDDFSQDNSLSVLGVMKSGNGKLHLSSLNQETRFSEKLAQNISLKAAKNNWVMVIPASAIYFSDRWLKTISGLLSREKDVVVNYSNIVYTGRFYNQLYRNELFWQQVKSAGFNACGMPLVYTEENVAFRKEKYFDMGGYGQMVNEPFANLELLINKFIRKGKVEIHFQKDTSIQKDERVEHSEYLNLLKKSFRIEKHLAWKKRMVLIIDEWTRLLFLPSFIFVIVFVSELWLPIAIVIILKIIMHLLIIKRVVNRLNERKIFISSLVYELLMPYYKVFYHWHFNRRSRKQKWRTNI